MRIRNVNEDLPALSLPIPDSAEGKAHIRLEDGQIGQIRGAAVCVLKGTLDGQEMVSNRVALVQLNRLLRDPEGGGGSQNRRARVSETGEDLVPLLDGLGNVRDAIEFLDHCSIKFDDGEDRAGGGRTGNWRPRDPFTGDIPTHWLSLPIINGTEELRDAIWRFVERHQREKLSKHVRRGNINGLKNFLDIFRTLNGLLLTYNQRQLDRNEPVIPHPYVTEGIQKNLALLIGSRDPENTDGRGFVEAIRSNLGGDEEMVRERLEREHVAEMVRAAVEAMVAVRKAALKKNEDDEWTLERLWWVSQWIDDQRLQQPSKESIALAGQEYRSAALAA